MLLGGPRSGSGSIPCWNARITATVPHRTALNRSIPNRTELCVRCAISGTLEVRSKFAQGTVRVRYGCGTGAVRYFNFFMTDTVYRSYQMASVCSP